MLGLLTTFDSNRYWFVNLKGCSGIFQVRGWQVSSTMGQIILTLTGRGPLGLDLSNCASALTVHIKQVLHLMVFVKVNVFNVRQQTLSEQSTMEREEDSVYLGHYTEVTSLSVFEFRGFSCLSSSREVCHSPQNCCMICTGYGTSHTLTPNLTNLVMEVWSVTMR